MELTVVHPAYNTEGLTPSCAGCDTDAWMEIKPTGRGLSFDNETAIKICNECPVKAMCLEWALHHEDWGIWAGTIPSERARMRRELGIRLESPEVDVMEAYFVSTRAEEGVRDTTTRDLPDGWYDFKNSDKWIEAGMR